jgi:hydroxymethylpyrimidine pyrophosphatase-like HAD family hydrolase
MKQYGSNVIALDFDGTLVESNQIKDQAFDTTQGCHDRMAFGPQ